MGEERNVRKEVDEDLLLLDGMVEVLVEEKVGIHLVVVAVQMVARELENPFGFLKY